MAMKKITIALIAAGLIGATHWVLHSQIYGNDWVMVGYWIVGATFVYLAFLQDKIIN